MIFMDILTVTLSLAGLILGGVITFFVSRHYYIQATKDLKDETTKLRKYSELMLRGMESAGWVEYNRDSEGNPIGIIFIESGGATIHLSASGDAKVIRNNKDINSQSN
jgi:hypothetical protein